MSLSTLLLVGIITAVEFFYILYSMDKKLFLTALGYKAYLDAFFGFGITAYMALTGTISGIIISAFSGVMFSLCLFVTAKLFGYRKKVKGKWQTFEPEWKLGDLKNVRFNF
jgi:hypothetical protein